MTTETIVALFAALIGTLGAGLSIYGQIRVTRLSHALAEDRNEHSRQVRSQEVMAKYRDPLLYAAYDLQSRLYNIVQLGFLSDYALKSKVNKEYAIRSTLFVITDYLGWVEILRREIRFLDLGDLHANQRLSELLSEINHAFCRDTLDPTFRLLRGQQRALGELVISPPSVTGDHHLECIGLAAFMRELDNPDVADWFIKLRRDIERLMEEPGLHFQRLIALQHELIDLVDFFDPDCARFPAERRGKINL